VPPKKRKKEKKKPCKMVQRTAVNSSVSPNINYHTNPSYNDQNQETEIDIILPDLQTLFQISPTVPPHVLSSPK
jgi:hypothetical protein